LQGKLKWRWKENKGWALGEVQVTKVLIRVISLLEPQRIEEDRSRLNLLVNQVEHGNPSQEKDFNIREGMLVVKNRLVLPPKEKKKLALQARGALKAGVS